ncbi:MAG: hypothetical protein GX845_01360 [Erysipelothrix sp.]|nr:hypothetical protein [Erysipelothrix sp.]
MKIFYIKQSLFESNYRCEMVRKRLLKHIIQEKPQVLIISGCKDKDSETYVSFLETINEMNIVVLDNNGKYKVNDITIFLNDTHLLVNSKLITPMEGCVSVLNGDPFALSYIVLDIFADESFANYHGDLDELQWLELQKLLSK